MEYQIENILKELTHAFIDDKLRRFENSGIVAIDTNIILDVLGNRNDGARKYGNFFKEKLVTLYRRVFEETLFVMKNKYSCENDEEYGKLINLLNRENVRILTTPCGNWKKLIQEFNFDEDEEKLLVASLEKNLEESDIEILVQAMYEKVGIITRDLKMRAVAKIYKIPLTPNKKFNSVNSWKEFLANKGK